MGKLPVENGEPNSSIGANSQQNLAPTKSPLRKCMGQQPASKQASVGPYARVWRPVLPIPLGVTSPFFPGILLSTKPPKPSGNGGQRLPCLVWHMVAHTVAEFVTDEASESRSCGPVRPRPTWVLIAGYDEVREKDPQILEAFFLRELEC